MFDKYGISITLNASTERHKYILGDQRNGEDVNVLNKKGLTTNIAKVPTDLRKVRQFH